MSLQFLVRFILRLAIHRLDAKGNPEAFGYMPVPIVAHISGGDNVPLLWSNSLKLMYECSFDEATGRMWLYCPMRGQRVFVQTVYNMGLATVWPRVHYRHGDEAKFDEEWRGCGPLTHADGGVIGAWERRPWSLAARLRRYDPCRGVPSLVGTYPSVPGQAVPKRDAFTFSVAHGGGKGCVGANGGSRMASRGQSGWGLAGGYDACYKVPTRNRFAPLDAASLAEFPPLVRSAGSAAVGSLMARAQPSLPQAGGSGGGAACRGATQASAQAVVGLRVVRQPTTESGVLKDGQLEGVGWSKAGVCKGVYVPVGGAVQDSAAVQTVRVSPDLRMGLVGQEDGRREGVPGASVGESGNVRAPL